jgi:hypothetical protein
VIRSGTVIAALTAVLAGAGPDALAHFPSSPSRCTRDYPVSADHVDVAIAGIRLPYPSGSGAGAWTHRTWVYVWPDGNVEANAGGPAEGTDARVQPDVGAPYTCITVAGIPVA